MNEVRKELLQVIQIVYVYNQALLAQYVECEFIDLWNPPGMHYGFLNKILLAYIH